MKMRTETYHKIQNRKPLHNPTEQDIFEKKFNTICNNIDDYLGRQPKYTEEQKERVREIKRREWKQAEQKKMDDVISDVLSDLYE